MKTINIAILALCMSCATLFAQPFTHSHNDYEHEHPFYDAFKLGYASIEADIYLKDGGIYVSHDYKDITPERTFKSLYLDPILKIALKKGGFKYKNGQNLQLLIDLKTGGETLRALETLLKPYRNLFDVAQNPKAIRLIISGSMPAPEKFADYDAIFFFDGRQNINYPDETIKRVPLVSIGFASFGKWDGIAPLQDETLQKMKSFVAQFHSKGQQIRIWGMPNSVLSYQVQKEIGADFIGTDDLKALLAFLK